MTIHGHHNVVRKIESVASCSAAKCRIVWKTSEQLPSRRICQADRVS